MKATSVLHTLYHAIISLFTGRKILQQTVSDDTPRVESAAQRQYFVSHIDDYCDCV